MRKISTWFVAAVGAFALLAGALAVGGGVADAHGSAANPMHPTSVTLSCPSETLLGVQVTCTVTIVDIGTGYSGATGPANPVGTVTFSTDGPGTFEPPAATCALANFVSNTTSSCTIHYTPTEFGSDDHRITADYPNSGTTHGFFGGTAHADIAVTGALITLAKSCAAPDENAAVGFLLSVVDEDSETVNCGQATGPILVGAGTYTISEGLVSNWDLMGVSCDGPAVANVNLQAGTASITVADGDDVTCTFTNQQLDPVSGDVCKAAPAIANEYVAGLADGPTGRARASIISQIAQITGQGDDIAGTSLPAARDRCTDYGAYVEDVYEIVDSLVNGD